MPLLSEGHKDICKGQNCADKAFTMGLKVIWKRYIDEGQFLYWTEVLVDISWNQGNTRNQKWIRKVFGLIVAVKDNDCFLSLCLSIMVVRVVEFSSGGYKVNNVFAQKSTHPKEIHEVSELL